MPRPFQRFFLLALFVAGALLVWGAQRVSFAQDAPAPVNPAGDPVIAAAGDIAKCNRDQDSYTAYLLESIDGPILALGDNAYEAGSLQEFNDCYDPTWGRHKDRVYPVPGNHEYVTSGAEGYFTYFGDRATPLEPGCKKECKGYYSFNVGTWHIVALNSEIPFDAGSEQEQWLRADLAANPTVCTLAYWHRPRYSSGYHLSGIGIGLWQALYDYGADVVLVGHDHDYERFAPQDNYGQADPRGIREFVVGTGGDHLRDFKFIQPNSEVRNSETWGVLKLTLHPDSYDWEFVPMSGQTFTDAGSAPCVTAGSLPPAPAPVATEVTVTLVSAPVSEAAPAAVAQPAAAPQTAALPAGGTSYAIQAGDTLFGIAIRYGLDWTSVAAANGLTENSILQIGQVIRLPGVQETEVATATPITGGARTLASLVATPTATSAAAVASQSAPAATSTAVTATASTIANSAAAPAGSRYIVQAGDTLFGIALRYALTWQEIATPNSLGENDILQVGQELIIPDQPAAATPAAAAGAVTVTATAPATITASTAVTATTLPAAAPAITTGRFHTVVAGDTITNIALANEMDWRRLLSLNGLNENSILQVGQRLRLE